MGNGLWGSKVGRRQRKGKVVYEGEVEVIESLRQRAESAKGLSSARTNESKRTS